MYFSKIYIKMKASYVFNISKRLASDIPSCFDGKLVATCRICKVPEKAKACDQCPRVVILGAGMAGMSAASRLYTAGFQDFLVLEANNRVGGRVYSAWSGEGINELGAEWLEGETNPVLKLVALEGLTSCKEDMSSGVWMTEGGTPLGFSIVNEAKKVFHQIQDLAHKTFCDNRESDFFDVSLKDFYKKKEKEVKWKSKQAQTLFKTLCYGGMCRLGGPANELSLNDVSLRFRSESRLRIREGLVCVFGPMLKDVPQSKIKLKHKVIKVYWDECPVRIVMEDCSEITADIVIVTFSLGVLKNNFDIFEPELPEDKGEAIRLTGFDTMNKIFLDYDEPFWLRGDGRIFFSQPGDPSEATEWTSAIFQIREICGGRNTLQISLCGSPAVEVEYITEEEIAKKITCLLRKYTGVNNTPYPIGVTRTRWKSDPQFVGSVSFIGKNSNSKHLRVLAQPLPLLQPYPKLLFAGDATSGGHIGTIEGARLSGYREAERIIDIVCEHGWPPQPRHKLKPFLCEPK